MPQKGGALNFLFLFECQIGQTHRNRLVLHPNGVSEILAPNNFGSALSKAALKGPLKGPLKAVIGRLQLISWSQCRVIILRKRRIFFGKKRKFRHGRGPGSRYSCHQAPAVAAAAAKIAKTNKHMSIKRQRLTELGTSSRH